MKVMSMPALVAPPRQCQCHQPLRCFKHAPHMPCIGSTIHPSPSPPSQMSDWPALCAESTGRSLPRLLAALHGSAAFLVRESDAPAALPLL